MLIIKTKLTIGPSNVPLTSMSLHIIYFSLSTNTLEHTLIFLKAMINKHVFMNLISLGEKFSPH